MHLLLSGEGATDIGVCHSGLKQCDCAEFQIGPMSSVVDQLIEASQGYEFSYLQNASFSYVSESFLAENKQNPAKKRIRLRGKKKSPETQYYYENARALAVAAKLKAEELNDTVIAVLFRDADGTASAGRGHWRHKRDSMINGFQAEGFEFGVPMIPKPKSEAWLLCAVKESPYQACNKLEDESGNDSVEHSLKDQLSAALNGKDSIDEINDMLLKGSIDVHQINMDSFNQFKQSLDEVVKKAMGLPL